MSVLLESFYRICKSAVQKNTCPHCQCKFTRPHYLEPESFRFYALSPRQCPACHQPIQLTLGAWNISLLILSLALFLIYSGALGEAKWLRLSAVLLLLGMVLFVPVRYRHVVQ